MKKNNNNILIARELQKIKNRIKWVVPAVYASFCKVLFEQYGWESDQIEELFKKTDEEWAASEENDFDMIKWCEDTTGILVAGPDYVGETE